MHRDVLEATVLDGLQHELMNPKLVEIFRDEYARHQSRITRAEQARMASDKAAPAKYRREMERMVQAILDGVPGSEVKDKIAELEARKVELEGWIASQTEETPALLHPKMAGLYRRQIENLRETLAVTANRRRAVEALRALIDEICWCRSRTATRPCSRSICAAIWPESCRMVAAAGFEPSLGLTRRLCRRGAAV